LHRFGSFAVDLTVKLATGPAGGFTVRLADFVAPENDALIRMLAADATALVVTVKFAVDAPAGTVMLPGTKATPLLLLCRLTPAPPEGAPLDSVTVPVTGVPPTTELDERVTEESVGVVVFGLDPQRHARAPSATAPATAIQEGL
jgi:hypothetical protein